MMWFPSLRFGALTRPRASFSTRPRTRFSLASNRFSLSSAASFSYLSSFGRSRGIFYYPPLKFFTATSASPQQNHSKPTSAPTGRPAPFAGGLGTSGMDTSYKPVDQVAQFMNPNKESSAEPPKHRALDPPAHQQELNVKIGLHPLGLQAESKTVKQSEFDPNEVEKATAAPSVSPNSPPAAAMSVSVSGLSGRLPLFSSTTPFSSSFMSSLPCHNNNNNNNHNNHSPSFSYLYRLDSEVIWMPRNTPFSPKE